MLKLKNLKPYFSSPIKHCYLRLALNVKLLPQVPSMYVAFYILRGIDGQLITQCLYHLNL